MPVPKAIAGESSRRRGGARRLPVPVRGRAEAEQVWQAAKEKFEQALL
ncbi:MAG: hypothetical protein ACOYYJ_06935 [Chloroflexota bacterium]